jgi:hypothetical protein
MDASIQKEFLRDFSRRNSGPALAVFGKHPAWNDHMDDLGLSTPSLRACKRLLYIQGIAANASRQQSLPAGAEFLPYRHLLLWFRGREAILLRLLESEDGRGRGFFPLVGAVHFDTASMPDALRLLVPALRAATDLLRALSWRHDVVDQHRHAESKLRSQFDGLRPGEPFDPATPAEAAAMRLALDGSGPFVRLRLPVTRYDAAETLAALSSAVPAGDQAFLISQGDSERLTTVCAGPPDKSDFWFLREVSPESEM